MKRWTHWARGVAALLPILGLFGCGGGGGGEGTGGEQVGTVRGVVRRVVDIRQTGEPIVGVTVTAGGRTATTQADGGYTLSGVPAGAQTLTWSLAEHDGGTATVTVPAGSTLTQNLAVRPHVPETQVPEGTYTLAPNAVVIEPDAAVTVEELSDTRVVLSGDVPDIEPGTTLANQQGAGFLRYVTAVDRSGGRVELETQPAGLEDLVSDADIEFSGAPTDYVIEPEEGVQVINAAGTRSVRGPDGRQRVQVEVNAAHVTLDIGTKLERALSAQGVVGVSAHGRIECSIPVQLAVETEAQLWPPGVSLRHFRAATGMEVAGSVGVEFEPSTLAQPLTIVLGRIYGAPIPAGPLLLVPAAELKAVVELETSGRLAVEWGCDYAVMDGGEWRADEGWTSAREPADLSRVGDDFTYSATAKAALAATLFVGLKGEVDLDLYGLTGVAVVTSAGAEGELEVAYANHADEYEELSGTVDVRERVEVAPAIQLELLGINLSWEPISASYSASFAGYPVSLTWPLNGALPVVVD